MSSLLAFNDQPEIFNVSLLEDVENPFAVHSSKAIGEPPFFLGSVIFYAIKDAVQRTRKSLDDTGYFAMHMPATSERIRLSMNDEIALKAKSEVLGNGNDAEAKAYEIQASF